MNNLPFCPDFSNTKTISATATSSSATLATVDASANSLRVANAGTAVAFIRFGVGAQTALTTDMPVLPGVVEVFTKGAADTVAAICASGNTATIYLTCGAGE